MKRASLLVALVVVAAGCTGSDPPATVVDAPTQQVQQLILEGRR